MLQEAKIDEGDCSPRPSSKALVRDVGEFAHNVLGLAELQAQLLVADLRECRRGVLVPGVVLISGAALGIACFPIVLVALALWVIQALDVSSSVAFLIAAGVGAALSAVLCLVGWSRVRRHLGVLGRSREELLCNLRWIKKVLERRRDTRSEDLDNSWRTHK